MPKVFVINNSAHDFSDAERFGELVFLSSGKINRYEVASMAREFEEHLASSKPDDWLLPTGLSIMTSIAAAMFATRHDGRLNLLLYKGGRYLERKLVLR